jgi:Ni2+-binding GTPase involved in maturation of urease and hydrogenase
MTSRSLRPRYVMIGGFLGAGKTTAILRLAERLDRRGCRVGLITNDQSVGLVDTTLLSTRGFPVEEITGGCFCCRFDSLVDATCRLVEAVAPQVFIAEPVGSCTDLRATVSYPLQRLYGDAFVVAPLSVVIDPVRALRTLGVEPGAGFSGKVEYLYRKQLEEAAILVINKIDAVDPARVAALRTALARECPRARIFDVSARTGRGLDAWFEAIVPTEAGDAQPADSDMALDYGLYGEAEALLGWLNACVRLDASSPFDGNAWLRDMAARLQANLDERGIQIMHLKVTLSPGEAGGLAVLNQVRSEQPAELSHELIGLLAGADLVVNLRAEGDPALLLAALDGALGEAAAAAGLRAHVQQVEHLRPGQPTPTHRLSPV